jgi:tetratricopeptide (TPR) repeat protein/uncharacterized membrane protein
VNFVLHASNVLLVFALLRKLLDDFWRPAFAAALWAVHPVLTEAVTNMTGRADLLAGASLLGGLLVYLKSAEAIGWKRWAWLAGLAAIATLGVFSKENAAALAVWMVLYECCWWPRRPRARALLLGLGAVTISLQAMFFARGAVFYTLAPVDFPFNDNPLVAAGFWSAKLTALKALGIALGRLAWPATLSCDYSFDAIPLATGSAADWLAWTAVALAAALLVAAWRWNRALFFLGACAAIVMLPSSNLLLPVGTILAERFLYLPAIAFCLAVVVAADWLGCRARVTRFAPVLVCVLVVACGARTWMRNLDWQSDLALATATVRAVPASYKGHKMLAAALYGPDPSQLNRAIEEADKAIQVLDRIPNDRNNAATYRGAANYYFEKGKLLESRAPDAEVAPPDAAQAFRRAVELYQEAKTLAMASDARLLNEDHRRGVVINRGPDAGLADLDRAVAATLLHLGDRSRALEAAQAALEAEPFSADSYGALASALIAAGRGDEAAITLMQGVMLKTDERLREMLVKLYRSGLDTTGCATRPGGPQGFTINPACPIVQRHLCSAAQLTIRLHLSRGDEAHAHQVADSARTMFGCPAGLIDGALAESPAH